MRNGATDLANRRATCPTPTDWRLVLASAAAFIVLLAYALPMFPQRITAGTTRFSQGTTVELSFPVLVSGQHAAQATRPLNQELASVDITVEGAPGYGSGYGWLLWVALSAESLRHVSFTLSMLVPLLSAALMLLMLALALWGSHGLREGLIVANVTFAFLAPFGLLLGWLHQIDFSGALLALDRSALLPAWGFWLGLVGALMLFGGAWSFRQETERSVTSWWALVLAVILAIWLLVRARPYPYLEIWTFISDGILVTLRLCLISFAFILVVSLFGGLGRISKSPIIYGISSLYVELIRGIPLLVQLLFIWFALPQIFDVLGDFLIRLSPSLKSTGEWLIDLRLDPFAAAIIGFTICYGAYVSEIFRAGISSIHRGQMEAARSLGMNYIQAMRYIILPQAVRVILPPVGNEFVALLKDSSLVSVLAVSDLTRRGREYMSRTFLSFDTWIMVALCYLVLTLFSSRVVEHIESKSKFER